MTASRAARVAGKRVLVTGAARGLGRSHALRLAEEGADLILIDICRSLPEIDYALATEDDLAETVDLVAKQGRRCFSRVVDVRDETALRQAVDDGVEEIGGLDGAVANAGVLTIASWDKTTLEQWRTVVDVNLIGTWNTCAAAIPHLLAQGGGSLVNISSAGALWCVEWLRSGGAGGVVVSGVDGRERFVLVGRRTGTQWRGTNVDTVMLVKVVEVLVGEVVWCGHGEHQHESRSAQAGSRGADQGE